MITLYILCVLYTFFGFRRFKKLYGDYNLFGESPMVWTFILVLTTAITFATTITFIIMYLP